MKQTFLSCLLLLLLAGCQKENGRTVAIYLLKSFTTTLNQSTTPPTVSLTNPLLEDKPLVADGDIAFYTRTTTTFTLRRSVQARLQNFGPDKAFAVTVDGQPVYYGRFHPLYLSSITFGLATIAPPFSNSKELTIDFAALNGDPLLQQLDKRNDPKIILALKSTGRLR